MALDERPSSGLVPHVSQGEPTFDWTLRGEFDRAEADGRHQKTSV